MDLVAGDSREILLGIAVDDWAGFADRSRFDAHLALGGGLDPTWLDLFSEAVRGIRGTDDPIDFLDARRDLPGAGDVGERTVEQVDRAWLSAVAQVPEEDFDAIAGRWIDLLEDEVGPMPPDEKPWIRGLTSDLVTFARAAIDSPATVFAWSI